MRQGEEHRMPRLLAIDDSELIHRLLKARLKSERIEIHGATSAAEGLRMAQSLHPEVILLDIHLPECDGYDILRQLKSDSITSDIPVIVISALCETEEKVRCFDLGAIDFVSKPFDVSELKARVRSAVRMRQMMQLLAQRAQVDGLTGLWNRAHFDIRLTQAIGEALRHKSPLSLILCDLDRFKEINDTFGHPFGDRVLEVFAEILSHNRTSDISCRYGGEEIAIILPRTMAEDAVGVAERIRRQLCEHVWLNHPDLTVTASFGVTDLLRCERGDEESMVESADQALYASKRDARDCVYLATGSDERPLRASA